MKSSTEMAAMIAAVAANGAIGTSELAVTRSSDPFVNLFDEASTLRIRPGKYAKSWYFGPGPNPAGSKLARKAAKGKVGVR